MCWRNVKAKAEYERMQLEEPETASRLKHSVLSSGNWQLIAVLKTKKVGEVGTVATAMVDKVDIYEFTRRQLMLGCPKKQIPGLFDRCTDYVGQVFQAATWNGARVLLMPCCPQLGRQSAVKDILSCTSAHNDVPMEDAESAMEAHAGLASASAASLDAAQVSGGPTPPRRGGLIFHYVYYY